MTNRVLEEYLKRLGDALATTPDEERGSIVAEARAHLEEAIAGRMDADPAADLAHVTLQETRAFGDPGEIAAARATGPGHAPSPSRFRWPRWATALVAVLALALVAAVIVDIVDKPASFGAYHRNNVLENHTALVNDTFLVPPDADTLGITIHVDRESGCTGIRITDPAGEAVVDQWDTCGDIFHSLEAKPGLSGRSGEWRIELRHRGFSGSVLVVAKGTLG